ncbi:MAG TPA: ATPase, T2SS/T4P/T4SS family, partial [Gemmatimonadaceae bacterium]
GGISQVHVNIKAGVTFANTLRALLRQDPDVIMVGECRDPETANTALAAALSGQLVFTTVHSSDAPRTVERFVELGVSRASLAAGLSAILAQRLVRRLCSNCRHPNVLAEDLAARYNLERDRFYFEPRGCDLCSGLGYHDRIGIFELLIVDDSLRDAIARGVSSVEVARLARKCGYRTMAEDCLDKCRTGLTSVEEFCRVAVAVSLQ